MRQLHGCRSLSEMAEHLGHDSVYVGAPAPPVCHHSAVKLGTSHKDLTADLIRGQRVALVLEQIAQLANAQAGVARERPERQEWVERRADHDTFGQHAADLDRSATG